MSDFKRHLEESLQDATFHAEYDALEAQYAFAREVIATRIEKGITQADLAKLAGTSQANISKIEHGSMNPSFDLAKRIANGLGKRLCVSII